MLETNRLRQSANQPTFRLGDIITNLPPIFNISQLDSGINEHNDLSYMYEQKSAKNSNLLHNSQTPKRTLLNQSVDEGRHSLRKSYKKGSNLLNRKMSPKVLPTKESYIMEKQDYTHIFQTKSLKDSPKKLRKIPHNELQHKIFTENPQKGQDDALFHSILHEMRKQNKANFQKILDNKAQNITKEKQLQELTNSSMYQPRTKSQNDKGEPGSPSQSLQKSNLIRPRPIIKTKPRYTGVPSSFRSITPSQSRIKSDSGGKISFEGSDKSEDLVLTPKVSIVEGLQPGSGHSSDINLQNLPTYESLPLGSDQCPSIPVVASEQVKPKPEKFFKRSRGLSTQSRFQSDRSSNPSGSTRESYKEGEISSLLASKKIDGESDVNKTQLILSRMINGESFQIRNMSSVRYDRSMELKRSSELVMLSRQKEKTDLLERDKRYQKLLESELRTSFERVNETLERFQELKGKNDASIASIRKHY